MHQAAQDEALGQVPLYFLSVARAEDPALFKREVRRRRLALLPRRQSDRREVLVRAAQVDDRPAFLFSVFVRPGTPVVYSQPPPPAVLHALVLQFKLAPPVIHDVGTAGPVPRQAPDAVQPL